MNSLQEDFKDLMFTSRVFKGLAQAVAEKGVLTTNAKTHGRTTKWSEPIPMTLPVYVSVSEANPDKAEPGDYYAYISVDQERTGMPAWLPSSHTVGFQPKAELKARYRPSDQGVFVFGTNQDDSEKNIVARIRRVFKVLPEGEAKEAIARAFSEERVKLL